MFGFKPDDIFGHQLEDLLVSNVSIRKFVDSFPADGEDFVETPSVQYLHRRSGERFRGVHIHVTAQGDDLDQKLRDARWAATHDTL